MTRIARLHRMQVLLALLLPLAAAASARAQQSPDFGSLVSQASRAIQKNHKIVNGGKVLVLDFTEAQGTPTELGHNLAAAFSDALSKQAKDFEVVDLSQLAALFARDRISPETFRDQRMMTCYGSELDAKVVLEGALEDSSGQVKLTIDAWQVLPSKMIFEEKTSLALTPEMQALVQKPAASFAISSADYISQTGLPQSGEKNYSFPRCRQCPEAEFSHDAVVAHGQGTVFLVAEIDATGSPRNVVVTHGIPCRLNQQAITAVEGWTLDPATGPDGKPTDIEQTIEVTFRLY